MFDGVPLCTSTSNPKLKKVVRLHVRTQTTLSMSDPDNVYCARETFAGAKWLM